MPAVSASAKAKLKENQRLYAVSPRGKWTAHKSQAKSRGIGFDLTFDQWWKIWQDSGKWEQRGKAVGQFCMSRNHDTGAYTLGNVEIVQVIANLRTQLGSGQHKAHKLSKSDIVSICALCAAGKTTAEVAKIFGVSQPYVSRLVNGKRGHVILSME